MPLNAGSRLGPYEITAKLGEGGMGEVYLVEHLSLGREEALKILHPSFAGNREFAGYAINWLLNRAELLEGIGRRPVKEYRIIMTNSQLQSAEWILLAGLPGGSRPVRLHCSGAA